mmetsp:Transcript_9073/g.12905  ORF Transcript_9073/g.12905 Transcript_9073/m.12905 type:complete len:426 (+) Transcript_9073:206-1483(+)|eukprot:CAMPEP_0184868692 /NCGR_PEP_ID=MMETSP0580-20130426/31407_1 /TAXON_ID=1118495 /ORGANISM="Dactyliosolen fragilissimus" /LENGTH=425 /DNA_ID=CAMNT_0027369747 /DNA_START=184 /DNA_END=1461 /DNA_ORIENTATION=-
MVKRGLFGVRLIRNEIIEGVDEYYQEHECKKSNEIYAEVEPDNEYYIELRSDANEAVYADIDVDGSPLQKGCKVPSDEVRKFGVIQEIFTYDCDIQVKALKFEKTEPYVFNNKNSPNILYPIYWTGKVVVQFYGDPCYRISDSDISEPDINISDTKIESKVVVNLVDSASQDKSKSSQSTPKSWQRKAEGGKRTFSARQSTVPQFNTSRRAKRSQSRESFIQRPDSPPIYSKTKTNKITYAPKAWEYCKNNFGSAEKNKVGYIEVPGMPTVDNEMKAKEKGVKSIQGEGTLGYFRLTYTPNRKYSNCRKKTTIIKEPELLGSVTLNYCSTVGLIYKGILKSPPKFNMKLAVAKYKDNDKKRKAIWENLFKTGLAKKIKIQNSQVSEDDKDENIVIKSKQTSAYFCDLTSDCDQIDALLKRKEDPK